MIRTKLSPKLLAGIILAVIFGIALYIRVCLPYDQVFSGDWIKFTGVDAYYHMRLVDNLVQNFPQSLAFDVYTYFPYGTAVSWLPFFDGLLAGITWLLGAGSPTQHTIDVIGAYFPAILGALTVIPVYFIGKELFNRWVGLISAGLLAVLPGEFLGRSILGFTDHHVAETLLTTVTILFLILAVKSARQRKLTLNHIKRRDWAASTKPLIYSLLTGIFLGVYLLTWAGALLFVFIIFIYFVIQFIIDHLRGEATEYLGIIGTVLFLVALIVLLPVSQDKLYVAPLVIALLASPALAGISHLMRVRKMKPAYYPLALVGVAVAGLIVFYIISPSLINTLLQQFSGIFIPHTARETVLEMQSILFHDGSFSFTVVWANFTTAFLLSLISLGILIYLVIKRGSAEKNLFIVWSLVILAATLGQCRFAYYLAVNVALLTGYLSVLIFFVTRFVIAYLKGEPANYLSWQTLESPDVGKLTTETKAITPKIVKKKKGRIRKIPKPGFQLTGSRINIALASIVIFLLVFLPNIGSAVATAKAVRFAPDDAWCSSLSWLRENTPEPFGNPDFYYELYEPPPPGENYNYPETAYGIMAWWDYGHWITRIARRLPNATPAVWGEFLIFFSAQDEVSANEVMDKLGIRYVIIDYDLASVERKFYAVPTLAGRSPEEFYDVYYQSEEGEVTPMTLFYPEYYRSLHIRLYNFDGEAVTPQSSTVVLYERISREGITYNVITELKSFDNYEEATAYVSSQETDNCKLVGTDPFASPVPLEEMEHYELIYSADVFAIEAGGRVVPRIKIFEYIK